MYEVETPTIWKHVLQLSTGKHFFMTLKILQETEMAYPLIIFLNYGYAILRAVIARSLVTSGLLPTLGIHHHNRYNAYCLADDIMEPYRPFIDQLVYQLYSENKMELTKEVKASLLSIPQ